MYLRLVMLGTGKDEDQYRVSLPSYSMVDVDYANMFAIVSITSRLGPSPMPSQGSPLYPLLGDKYVLIGLDPGVLANWWAKLARSYPAVEPPYEPDFP